MMITMIKIIPFVLLVLLHSVLRCSAETTSQLDTIVLQLRSVSDSKNDEVLEEVITRTKRFLNDYFGAYFTNAVAIGFFDETRITGNSFGIQGGAGSFISAIEFDTVLVFNQEPAPEPELLENLLANSFRGPNLGLFLESILSSDDPFLSQLTAAFVDINGQPVGQKSLESSSTNDAEEKSGLENWEEIAIYTAAGLVGAIVFLSLVFLCRCWCRKSQIQDETDVINVSKIEFPTPTQDPPKPQSQRLKSTNYNGRRVQPSGMAPSSSRSIVSQDSGLFSYNPSAISHDGGTLSLGSVANINIYNRNFDLEAWQKQNTISSVTPAPFGDDISAIAEPKDSLSVMEEGDEDMLRIRASQRLSNQKSSSRQYSSKRGTPSIIQESRGRDSSSEETNSNQSDVINDLKNLSLQIEHHRRSKKTNTSYRG